MFNLQVVLQAPSLRPLTSFSLIQTDSMWLSRKHMEVDCCTAQHSNMRLNLFFFFSWPRTIWYLQLVALSQSISKGKSCLNFIQKTSYRFSLSDWSVYFTNFVIHELKCSTFFQWCTVGIVALSCTSLDKNFQINHIYTCIIYYLVKGANICQDILQQMQIEFQS